jgi:hypothetical protein
MDTIEIPFGAKDFETLGWTFIIPEGFTAKIEDGKIIVKKEETEDERIRKSLIYYLHGLGEFDYPDKETYNNWLAYLEKQKELFESGRGLYYYDGEKTTYCGYPATEENPNDFAISQQEKQKESLHTQEICKENADSFTDGIIEVRSFQRGIEEGRRLEREKQKEQKPIQSKRLANEVIKYLTKCGYSPVLKDDSKKKHFHIDIPRHEDDFWLSEEYKHCRSVLGEYYMEGDYGDDTYTLYVWREKKETKPAEWSEDNIKELTEFEAAMLHIGMSFFGGSAGLNPNNTNEVKKQAKLLLELVPKQEWGEKDNIMLENTILCLKEYCLTDEITWLKSLRPQQDRCKDCPHRGDMFLLTQGFKSGKHELAIRFMDYLDENRPEDKMGLSNSECEDIDKAFNENDWNKIIRYIEKYKPRWKPSEEQMSALSDTLDFMPDTFKQKCTLVTLQNDLEKLI